MEYLFSAFTHSVSIEMAITELEEIGLGKQQILAVPLQMKEKGAALMDKSYHTDGKSMVDLAAAFGAVFMLLGSIYGLHLYLGPVLWGLFGLLAGILLGLAVNFFYKKKKGISMRKRSGREMDVVLLIHCPRGQTEKVQQILLANGACGVGRLKRDSGISE